MRHATLAVWLLFAVGCYDQLKPGRCERDADCAPGLTCSQDMTAGRYHRCMSADGGIIDGGGGDGGDAAMPECTENWQCSPAKPVCVAGGVCSLCDSSSSQICAMLHPVRPVCGPSGACVECASNVDCQSATKPSCDPQTNTCSTCSRDGDCAGRSGPGICMAHQDGRCASEGETIYVQQIPACTDTTDPTAGTAAMPFCGLGKAAVALSAARRLFVIRGTVQGTAWTLQGTIGAPQISLVGQQTATIAGGASPGLRILTADVYVRDVVITLSAEIGINAANDSVLRLDGVKVDTNRGGGILLDASRFDIRNTIVTANGPGLLPGDISWGGIRIQNAPATGPSDLTRVTIRGNSGPGLLCTTAVQGTGVLAIANSTLDIGSTCGVTACGAPSPTCGATE